MSNARITPVRIRTEGVALDGDLVTAADGIGTIVFAHGSGSSRFSPRNRHVAQVLRSARLATLLVDLLTPDEAVEDARTRRQRFDIALLTDRLIGVVEWARLRSPHPRPVGLFGASTGAAAALAVAALRPELVGAVVSRGGRPDLAGDLLPRVEAPTLLIVGGADTPVIRLNQEARALMRCETALRVVPGATHLFEEPGALDTVAVLARDWFTLHLGDPATPLEER